MRASHISTSSTVFPVQHRISGQLMLIMTIGLLPDTAARLPYAWLEAWRDARRTSSGRLPAGRLPAGRPSARTPAGPDARRPLATRPPDAMKPGIHCARTHWIRGFIGFCLARRTRIVMLMMLA